MVRGWGKFMGGKGKLTGVEDQLIKDLKSTTIPLRRLGKEYGSELPGYLPFLPRERDQEAQERAH